MYKDDKEEVQKMIDESIKNAQIKANKVISEEIQSNLILLIMVVTIAILFFNTIKYTSNQKTIRKNIEKFGEYNSQVMNEVIINEY